MYKGYKSVERERGVALIFTLAMLGLLMMMLLAFVGSMSVKKTVSSNAANKTQLNLLVDSAAARAALQMRDLEREGKPLDYAVSKPVSAESGGSGSGADSINSKFETKLTGTGNDIDLYKTGLVNNQHNGVTPEWINVTDSITGGVTPVARYAYAVIPNAYPILNLRALGNEARIGGALNEFKLSAVDSKFPNFTINTSTEKPYLTDKESYKILYLGDNLVDYNDNLLLAYTTIGDNLVEDVYYYKDFSSLSNSGTAILRRYDLGVKLKSPSGSLFDSDSVASNERVPLLLFGNTSSSDDGDMNDFTTGYDTAVHYKENGVDVGEYPQNNKAAEYLPFFRKFDNGSEKGTFDDKYQLRNQIAANLIDYMLKEETSVTSDISPEKESITWNGILGTVSEQGSWRLDIGDATMDKKWPSYTGNKRTLYLNEAGVVVWFELETRADNRLYYTVHVIPMVELIDIYGLGITDAESAESVNIDEMLEDYCMGVSGKVKFRITAGNSSTDLISLDLPDIYTKPSEYVNISKKERGMYFIPKWSISEVDKIDQLIGNEYKGSFEFIPGASPSINIEISDVKVEITAAKLLKKDNYGDFIPVDFAKIEADGDNSIEANEIYSDSINVIKGTHNVTLYASAYTNDPRQNLNKDDWDNKRARFISGTPIGSGYTDIDSFKEDEDEEDSNNSATSFGKVNPHDYEDIDSDKKDSESGIKEAVGDNSTGEWEIAAVFEALPDERPISTAFIRQAPMESLWELGFIHRGIKWQTINLKAVQTSPDWDISTFSDSSYEKGDAEILDMVCLNYGDRAKIDLNARDNQFPASGLAQAIWNELFSLENSDKIKVGNPDLDLTAGNELSTTGLGGSTEEGGGDSGDTGEGGGESVTKILDLTDNILFPDEFFIQGCLNRKLFLRRSAIAPALFDAVKSKYDTDAQQEAYVGKVIGLTDAYAYPPEVRVIVQAELLSQQTGATTDSVKKLVIMKRTLDGRYVISEILPL